MSIDVFSIHCDALDGARLAGFKGTEALNRPFELDVFFTVPVGTDVKGAVGARATLTADRDDGRGPMCWHGILASIRLLHETAERALYRAVLVPRLWLLGRHVRSFVHTKKKIDAFTADTLQDGGLSGGDFAFHTSAGAYPLEEFVCQYRESHLDFVHRWFEREGLYYYFEHPEGAGASERMIVVDDKAHHHPLFGEGRVRYFPAAGHDASAGECFRELSADFELLPASVLVSDYNYANPAAPVAGEKAISQAGQGKIREYGYRVFTEGEAKRLAQVKAQSMACRELVLTATGTYLGLRAGYTFELEEGPSDLPVKYLAIEVRHAGAVSGASPMVLRYTGLDAKETYRVDVVAIPSNVQYRAPQLTAWPRIYGFENGTVDGPGESQYAQIDDQGRYLVRFKFDVSDLPDGSTSTYLRMMQPHGGSSEGWHFPLRKGTEVMVSFQGGDPDRPVIAGVVPNAIQPSNVTARNHTQNVLRTGSNNYLIMDDTIDAQYIDVSTPVLDTSVHMGNPVKVTFSGYDDQSAAEVDIAYDVSTAGNAGFWVGGGWWEEVGKNKNVYVRGPVTIGYQNTHKLEIGGKSDEFYNGGLTQKVQKGYEQRITGDGEQHVVTNWTQQVAGKNHGKYGTWEVNVDGTCKTSVGSTYKLLVNGACAITAAGDIEIESTAGQVSVVSPSQITIRAPHIEKASDDVVDFSAKSILGFGTANAFGIQKYDLASIAAQHTGISISVTGTKLEATGSYLTRPGSELKNTSASIANCALSLLSAGMTKVG